MLENNLCMFLCQGSLQSGIGPPPPLVPPPGCRVGLPGSPRPTVLPKVGVCAEPEGGNAHPAHHHPHLDPCAPTDSADPGTTRPVGAAVTPRGREDRPLQNQVLGNQWVEERRLQGRLSSFMASPPPSTSFTQTGSNLEGSEASYGPSFKE